MTESGKLDPQKISDILKHNRSTSELYKQLEERPNLFSNGLVRAFAAAVIDKSFEHSFVKNPLEAIKSGFLGETFDISDDERKIFESMNAESLTDLASVVAYLRKNTH